MWVKKDIEVFLWEIWYAIKNDTDAFGAFSGKNQEMLIILAMTVEMMQQYMYSISLLAASFQFAAHVSQ